MPKITACNFQNFKHLYWGGLTTFIVLNIWIVFIILNTINNWSQRLEQRIRVRQCAANNFLNRYFKIRLVSILRKYVLVWECTTDRVYFLEKIHTQVISKSTTFLIYRTKPKDYYCWPCLKSILVISMLLHSPTPKLH